MEAVHPSDSSRRGTCSAFGLDTDRECPSVTSIETRRAFRGTASACVSKVTLEKILEWASARTESMMTRSMGDFGALGFADPVGPTDRIGPWGLKPPRPLREGSLI